MMVVYGIQIVYKTYSYKGVPFIFIIMKNRFAMKGARSEPMHITVICEKNKLPQN